MEGQTQLSGSSPTLDKPLVFYKLIVDSNDHKKLRIPGKFLKSIGDELSPVASLFTPCGHRCFVGLEKEGNKLWFCEGWQEFMKTYSISDGHFIVFRYEGDSKFSVSIFNTNEVNYLDLLCYSEKLTDSKQCGRTSEDGSADNEATELLNQNLSCASSKCLENGVPDQCKDSQRTGNIDCIDSVILQKISNSSFVSEQQVRKKDRNAGSLKRIREPAQYEEDGNTKKSQQLVRNISPEFYRAILCTPKDKGQQESVIEKKSFQRVTQMSHDAGVRISKNDHTESASEFEWPNPEDDGQRVPAIKKMTPENEYYKYESPTKRRKAENDARCNACPNESTQSKAVKEQGKEKAVEAATMFKSNHPFCWILLQPAHVNDRAFLHIPSAFSIKHLKGTCGIITLKISDGNHWFVHAINNSGEIRLTQGWNRFVKDNKLVEGDVCVFELTETKDVMLKVSMFRDAEDDAPLNQCRKNSHLDTNDFQLQSAEDNCIQFNESSHSKSVGEHEFHGLSEEEQGSETSKITNQRADLSNMSPVDRFNSTVSQSIRGRANGVKEKKKQINATAMFKSSNPFCQIHLQPSHLNERRAALNIPSIFARKYLKHGVIKLEVSGGHQWSVTAINYCGKTYLSRGWIRFAKDMKLVEGDVCVFESIKTEDIILRVTIFQREAASTSQMQGNIHPSRSDNDLQESAQIPANANASGENDFHVPLTRCDVTEETIARTALNNEQSVKLTKRTNDSGAGNYQYTRVESYVVQAKEKAIHQAERFKSDNPFCRVAMTPAYLRNRNVYIPTVFAEKYLNCVNEHIKLEISDGKQWLVRVIKTRKGIYLSEGWSQFMRDVCLLDSDVCVLELIKSEDIVLKVTVFRDVRNANQPQSEEHSADSTYGKQEADQTARGYNFQLSKTEHLKSAGRHELHTQRMCNQEMIINQTINHSTGDLLDNYSKEVTTKNISTCPGQSTRDRSFKAEMKEKAVRETAMFESSNPFCMVSMRASYMSDKAQLHIPSKFAVKYFTDDCRFIKLEGSDKKKWPVRVIKAAGRIKFGHGWGDFVRGNNLEEGNVCIFERVEEKLFKVTIF